jgi:hypothetical protein
MTDGQPENLVPHDLRSLDSRVNRVINDIAEVKTRLTSIETRITSLDASVVHVHERMDGIGLTVWSADWN